MIREAVQQESDSKWMEAITGWLSPQQSLPLTQTFPFYLVKFQHCSPRAILQLQSSIINGHIKTGNNVTALLPEIEAKN